MKRKIIILIFFIAFSLAGSAQVILEITVKNIKEVKGSIQVGLFSNEKDFLKKAIVGKIVAVTTSTVTVIFENLKPGDYAVSVIHDENNNGELDKNGMGIPKEGFAFGNNAFGAFGPPSFKKSKVRIEKDIVKQILRLKHF